jgi:hypothetical protein
MLVTRRWTAGACAHLMFCLLATLLLLPSASSMTTTTTVTTSPSSTRKIDSLASISAGSSSRPWRWTSREPKEQQQRHQQDHHQQQQLDELQHQHHPVSAARRLCKALFRSSRRIHLALYWLTATNAVMAVLVNDYRIPLAAHSPEAAGLLGNIYSRVFFFARLRPRLLFSVGALLRALQQCTPLQQIIDPSAGVGAGVNICAYVAGSRWVGPVVVGWAATREFWVLLGARKVEGAHLPISVSITRELDRRKHGRSPGRDFRKMMSSQERKKRRDGG